MCKLSQLALFCFDLLGCLNCQNKVWSFYLETFSIHALWLSLCSPVLRFLIAQWLPFHSTPVQSHFRWPPLFLEGKLFSSFLNLSWRVRLPYLEIMVYWLIYHNGWANKKSWIAFANDPVFNNIIYIMPYKMKPIRLQENRCIFFNVPPNLPIDQCNSTVWHPALPSYVEIPTSFLQLLFEPFQTWKLVWIWQPFDYSNFV